jgi:ubiquitin-protein ligase E3 C
MYKNLLYLKNYDGNVEDLGLDFTIVNSEIGQTQVKILSFFYPMKLTKFDLFR